MVLCIIAFAVFGIMSLFSAKYRPLVRESFGCVFRTLMLRPCDTGLDDRLKAEVVSGLLAYSPGLARAVHRNFALISWIFVIITVTSFGYMLYGGYNFYAYGNCDGPQATGACFLNDITGDYGRFSAPTDLILPSSTRGLAEGNESAHITIIEFGCFTCPYTKEAEDVVERLVERPEVYYVFKPFPLPNHPYSYDAARAVLCARDQGKAWELRKKVFESQETCTADGSLGIIFLAEEAGLDMEKFNACYETNQTNAELDGYILEGKNSRIYATPTFFINNRAVVGPKTYEEFDRIITEEKQ